MKIQIKMKMQANKGLGNRGNPKKGIMVCRAYFIERKMY